MKNHNYPIVLGHQYRKGILAVKYGEHGVKFMICRLKKEYNTGEEFNHDDVKNVEQEIWFADRETLKTMIDVMITALYKFN
jgi:hypothetical protein